MDFEKQNSAGYLINHLARLFAQELREQIAPLGLAPAQFMALLELWREDGLTQKQLVERLDVEQATMANTIARMERDNLVERRALPHDGRARSIHLTGKARSMEAEATKAAKGINSAMLGTLSRDEQTRFIDFMQRVINDRKKMRD